MSEKMFICDETTIVKTESGSVQGYFCEDLYIFKGIPYAQAKRFQKPEKVPAWEGIKDTTSYGYVCPLLHQETPQGELLVPHRYWPMDENCQNLNVWTPGLDDKKRPVFVWLHGGGYFAGSSIEHDAYDGENLSRLGDSVVVSINHRLNVLGYLDLSDYHEKYEDSGNAGGNDIIASLQWVHDNIASFGGDPENVTVFGQSGGGGKVTTLLQSPPADGLYHKGVIMSGVLSGVLTQNENGDARPIVQALLEELGLTEEQIEELETIPYQTLAKAYEKVSPALSAKGFYVGNTPRVSASYVGDPLRVGFRKESSHIPLMVGNVFGEFAFAKQQYDKRTMSFADGEALVTKRLGEALAVPFLKLFEEVYPERNPVDVLCVDALFRKPAIAYAMKRCEMNAADVYAYLFDVDFPIESGKPAWHCSDIPYFFHNTHMVPAENIKGVTNRLEEEMFYCLASFGRSGDPNHDGICNWRPCETGKEYVMKFGTESKELLNFDHKLQEFMTADVLMQIAASAENAAIIH